MSEPTNTMAPPSATLMRVEGADDASLDGRWRYAKMIAQAGDMIPTSLWAPVKNPDGTMGPPAPSPGKVMVATETARMLGFHPLAGLTGVHVIEGKAAISPAMMSAKVRNDGHLLRIGFRGTVEGGDLIGWAALIRHDDPGYEYRVEWSLHDAMRAKLGTKFTRRGDGVWEWAASKNNWDRYPRAMLKARAVAEVCREAAEDSLMGATYIPDELGADTNEDGDPVASTTPTRDWVADIAALRTIDAASVLREELRVSSDYTPALWGALLARVGAMSRDVEDQAEASNEDTYDADGHPVDGGPHDEAPHDEAEVVVDPEPDETAEPAPAAEPKLDPVAETQRQVDDLHARAVAAAEARKTKLAPEFSDADKGATP